MPWRPSDGGSGAASPVFQGLLKKYAATPNQLAIAWLLKRSPVMLPIPGTGKVRHLEENVAAADFAALSAL